MLNAQARTAVNAALLFADTLSGRGEGRLDAAPQGAGRRFWSRALYRHLYSEDDAGFQTFSGSAFGVAAGVQFDLSPNLSVDLALADIGGRAKLDGGAGSDSRNGVVAAAQLSGAHAVGTGCGFASVGVFAGQQDRDGGRTVSNTGTRASATSSSSDLSLGALLQAGVRMGRTIHPMAGVSYAHTRAGGFAEHGGGAAGVEVDDYRFGTLVLSQTMRLGRQQGIAVGSALLRPHAEVGLAQELTQGQRALAGRFSTGTAFNATLHHGERDLFHARVGAELELTRATSLSAHYEFAQGGEHKRDQVAIGLNMRF